MHVNVLPEACQLDLHSPCTEVVVLKGGEDEVMTMLPLFLDALNKDGAGGVAENPCARTGVCNQQRPGDPR